jgi:hypothetical protein
MPSSQISRLNYLVPLSEYTQYDSARPPLPVGPKIALEPSLRRTIIYGSPFVPNNSLLHSQNCIRLNSSKFDLMFSMELSTTHPTSWRAYQHGSLIRSGAPARLLGKPAATPWGRVATPPLGRPTQRLRTPFGTPKNAKAFGKTGLGTLGRLNHPLYATTHLLTSDRL